MNNEKLTLDQLSEVAGGIVGGTMCSFSGVKSGLGKNRYTELEHGPGLHDSIHCLKGNENITTKKRTYANSLHNNGAFLPWHRG